MKRIFCLLILLLPIFAAGQIITTVDSIDCYDINGVVFDLHGNLYFTTLIGNQVKKMDSNFVTTNIAGTGATGFSGDSGLAINAKLNQPLGIAVDSEGNVFFADAGNNRIRKIDISTGVISTVAGSSTSGFYGDGGPATTAKLFDPTGVCFDNVGNLYIADTRNYRIRKIDASGIISTYVGNGTIGSSGDGGPATTATCYPTTGMLFDSSGNLFFTQIITYPTIRKVNSAGIISTIAGDTTSHAYNGDGIPATDAYLNPMWLAFDSNKLLNISDGNNRIRIIDSSGIIHTIAGEGVFAYGGDGGPATAAQFYGNTGIAFDRCGNLYVGQVNNPRIRKVTFDTSCTLSHGGGDTTTLSAEIIHTGRSITVYPNPVYSELTVTALNKINNITIYNLIGAIVYNQTYSTEKTEINMVAYPPGLYMVMITDDEGKKTVKKIVKE